jgi:hypothetical protein
MDFDPGLAAILIDGTVRRDLVASTGSEPIEAASAGGTYRAIFS